MQFTKDEEMDAELNMEEYVSSLRPPSFFPFFCARALRPFACNFFPSSDLERLSLQKKFEAPAFQVVSAIFKALSAQKIARPSANFTSFVHPLSFPLKPAQSLTPETTGRRVSR